MLSTHTQEIRHFGIEVGNIILCRNVR